MAGKNEITAIAIPTTETKQGVVFYKVVVECGGQTWNCLKRYSKFEELNSCLLKSEFAKKIPTGCELPPKKWKMMTSHSSPQFIEKRRGNLEMYLKRLVSVTVLTCSKPLQDFILSDRSGEISNLEGGEGTKKVSGNSQTAKGPTTSSPFVPKVKMQTVNCTCGLPLCVCKPVEEEEKKEEPKNTQKVKKPDPAAEVKDSKPVVATSSKAKSSGTLFAGLGFHKQTYDFNGNLNEQCRDAIKAGDTDGVRSLLEAKVDLKVADRTGNTLAHLAAMFNRLEAVKMLVEGGADIWMKNPSGETAVDLAPAALAHKMKQLQPKPSSGGGK